MQSQKKSGGVREEWWSEVELGISHEAIETAVRKADADAILLERLLRAKLQGRQNTAGGSLGHGSGSSILQMQGRWQAGNTQGGAGYIPMVMPPHAEEPHLLMLRGLRERLTFFYRDFCPSKLGNVGMILQQFCDRGSTVEALDELNQELKRAYGWDLGIYDTLSPGQVLGHHEAAMRLLEMIASNGADAKSGAGGWDVVATPALSRENSDFAAMAQQLSQQQQQQEELMMHLKLQQEMQERLIALLADKDKDKDKTELPDVSRRVAVHNHALLGEEVVRARDGTGNDAVERAEGLERQAEEQLSQRMEALETRERERDAREKERERETRDKEAEVRAAQVALEAKAREREEAEEALRRAQQVADQEQGAIADQEQGAIAGGLPVQVGVGQDEAEIVETEGGMGDQVAHASATRDEEPNDGASTIDASGTKETASSAMPRNGEKDAKTVVGPPLSPRWSGNASFSVTALYAYNPVLEDELRFAANDVIYIKGKSDDGWFWGHLKGRKGLVPANYVRVLNAVQRGDHSRPSVSPQPQIGAPASVVAATHVSNRDQDAAARPAQQQQQQQKQQEQHLYASVGSDMGRLPTLGSFGGGMYSTIGTPHSTQSMPPRRFLGASAPGIYSTFGGDAAAGSPGRHQRAALKQPHNLYSSYGGTHGSGHTDGRVEV